MKKIIALVLLIIFTFVFSFALYKIVNSKIETHKVSKLQEKILDNTTIEEKVIENDNNEESEFLNVDFTDLLKQNSDTQGWIRFGDSINHVFVQAKDNNYYLRRNFEKQHSEHGTLFMDYRNNNFSDQNTVLFGHNSRDMSGFGSLKMLLDKQYFDRGCTDIIRISTPEVNYNYQIFSVYTIETEEYYIAPTFAPHEFNTFIDTMKRRSHHNLDVSVDADDKILTLSTCHGFSGTTKRLVVHAKLIDVMER